MSIDQDTIQSIARIGAALWPESADAGARTFETWAAVEGLDLPDPKSIERAAQALLHRSQQGRAVWTQLDNPFFRLPAHVRALLAMLHQNRWSYARIARVLNISVEEVGTRAWSSRLTLAHAPEFSGSHGVLETHPTGSSFRGSQCPEYDASNPWTQHFMDEEISSAQRLFLQNHMMVCRTCRAALHRCREMIFHVDGILPQRAPDLTKMIRRAYWIRPTDSLTLWDAVRRFSERPGTRWLVVAMLACAFGLWALTRK